MTLNRIVKVLIKILPFVMLVACSGSDGTSSTPSTVSGIAADGYLQNATVCLDVNNNGRCDDGEPSAVTGAGGAFTLDTRTHSANDYPVVVEVAADTIDEDTGLAVEARYTLRAPAGKYGFVTPLTTLIQTKIDQNPTLDAQAAAQIIGVQLNVEDPDKLYADYVAGAADSELDGLHQGAQVVARAFGQVRETLIDNNLTGSLEDDYELRAVQVVTGKLLLSKLDQVAAVVQEGDDSFDPVAAVTAEANLLEAAEFGKVANQIRAIDSAAVVGAYGSLAGQTLYSFNEGGDDNGVTIVFFERMEVGTDAATLSDGDLREMVDFSDLAQPEEIEELLFEVKNGAIAFTPGEMEFTESHLSEAVEVDLTGLTFNLADLAQVKMQDTDLRAQEVTFAEGDVMFKVNGTYFPTDIEPAAQSLYDELAEESDYQEGKTLAQLVAYTHNKVFPFSDHGVVLGPKTYLKNFVPSEEEETRGTLIGYRRTDMSSVDYTDTITVGTYRIAELADGSGRACIVMDLNGFAEVNGVWDHLLIVNDAENNHDFEQIMIADTDRTKSAEALYFNESAMQKIFDVIDNNITYN